MLEQQFLKSPKQTIFHAMKAFRGRIVLMATLIVLGNIGADSIPYFIKLIADKVYDSASGGSVDASFQTFVPILTIVATILILQEVFFRTAHLIENSIVVKAYDRITSDIFEVLINRPVAYFEEKFSGEITRRVEQVGASVKYFLEEFIWGFAWPLSSTFTAIFLLSTSSIWLVAVFLVWLIFFLSSSYFLLVLQYKKSQSVSETQGNLGGILVDTFSNISLVQTFSAHKHEYSHYRKFMDQAIGAENSARRIEWLNRFHQGLSIIFLSSLLIFTSVFLFTKNLITVGDFVIVAAIIPAFNGIIFSFGMIVIRAIRQYGELKNSLQSLSSDVSSVNNGDRELIIENGHKLGASIDFEKISFLYPKSKRKVLDNFTLNIKPGEKVGLVGKSGAGKSTLVKLLLRSYNAESGKIKIAEQDISATTLHSLRTNIAFVPQDTALFNRTLYENILYAKPTASKREVLSASARAHAHDFISQYPKGYDTVVGERGVKLSGGQRQRIALARAILKNSPILVLDEATSALDSESEEIIQNGLQELFENRTVLAIAHRLSTLRSMDRIIVLEQGKIVEDGKPEDLLNKKEGIFKDLWEHQKKGFI